MFLKNVAILKTSLFSTVNHESWRCILIVFVLMGQCNTNLAALFWEVCNSFSWRVTPALSQSPQGHVERALPSKCRRSMEALSQSTGVSTDALFVPPCKGLHRHECDHKARNYSCSLSAWESDGKSGFGKAKASKNKRFNFQTVRSENNGPVRTGWSELSLAGQPRLKVKGFPESSWQWTWGQ